MPGLGLDVLRADHENRQEEELFPRAKARFSAFGFVAAPSIKLASGIETNRPKIPAGAMAESHGLRTLIGTREAR
jgi:hypothetical protein